MTQDPSLALFPVMQVAIASPPWQYESDIQVTQTTCILRGAAWSGVALLAPGALGTAFSWSCILAPSLHFH